MLFGLALLAPLAASARSFTKCGTDVVAYFTPHRFFRGRTKFSAECDGVLWLFAFDEHRARLLDDPAAIPPEFSGFSASAVSQGHTSPTEPAAWCMAEGRLYQTYDQNIKRGWERDTPGHIASPHVSWPGGCANATPSRG